MNDLPLDTADASELARSLVASEATGEQGPEAPVVAAHRVCDRLFRGLVRWVGPDGTHALMTRALADTHVGHPAMQNVRLGSRANGCLNGVHEAVQEHGVAAVATGLESVLRALIALLERLIGRDVTRRLLEGSLATVREK
jgi:hypothetical protein